MFAPKVKFNAPIFEHKTKQGTVKALPCDQLLAQDFAKGECGLCMGDISALAHIQDQYLLTATLASMRELQVKSPDLSKVPLKDQYDMVRPRYAQTFAESEHFELAIAKHFDRLNDAYKSVKVPATSPEAPVVEPQTE